MHDDVEIEMVDLLKIVERSSVVIEVGRDVEVSGRRERKEDFLRRLDLERPLEITTTLLNRQAMTQLSKDSRVSHCYLAPHILNRS